MPRRRRTVACATLLALACAAAPRAHAEDPPDLPTLAARMEATAVALIAHQPKRRRAAERYDIMGAGFFVTADGHIVTADHVLQRIIRPEGHVRRGAELNRLAVGWVPDPDAADATIITNARRLAVRVVKQDAGRDLALLHVDVAGAAPAMLSLDDAPTGTDVAFFGFPFGSKLGFRPLLNRGTISGRRHLPGRTEETPHFWGFIVDGSVHPGHSGAPIVDVASGAVVGMVQRRLTQTIPVAIASREIVAFLEDAELDVSTTQMREAAPAHAPSS